MSLSATTILLALTGGLLPALGWLWFFLHEDPHPEPRTKLAETFVVGMVLVPVAIAGEELIRSWLGAVGTNTLILWAVLEEVLKYGGAWFVALRFGFVDEPVDAIIYMVATALGFAAVENSLFLISPLSSAAFLSTVLTGTLRFLGATLVHVVASGVHGAILAFAFYKTKRLRAEAAIIGLTVASGLHAGFNLLISSTPQVQLLRIFALVWAAVVILMLLFERVKTLRKEHYQHKQNRYGQ